MLATPRLKNNAVQRQFWLPVILLLAVLSGTALALLPLKTAVILVAALYGLAGFLMDPIVALAAALFVGPLGAWLMVQVPGVPSIVGQLIFLLYLGLTGANFMLVRKTSLSLPPLLLPFCGFLFMAGLSLWKTLDLWQGFTELSKWVQMALILLLVYDRLASNDRIVTPKNMVGVLVAAGLLQAGLGIYQFALRGEGPETFHISGRFYRAYGTFMQPNPYAGFVAMLAAIGAGVCLVQGLDYLKKTLLRKKIAMPPRFLGFLVLCAVTLLLILGVVASWSRGGWVGFAAAVLAMLFVIPERRQRGVFLIAVLILGGYLMVTLDLVPQQLTARLESLAAYGQYPELRSVGINDANFSTLERMAHWHAALEMARSHFWLGVGLGNYEIAYPGFMLPNWTLPLGHAHNIYLNMLAETGFLGLCAYVMLLVALFFQLFRASRHLSGWQRGLAVGLLGAWTHMAVHNLVDNIMVNNVHLHMGVMLALSAYVIDAAQQEGQLCRDDTTSERRNKVSRFIRLSS